MAQARRWLCRAGCALCRPQPEIAAEIYKASEKLCASPELLGTVGADGDTLTGSLGGPQTVQRERNDLRRGDLPSMESRRRMKCRLCFLVFIRTD
jgi:hypothetical protein